MSDVLDEDVLAVLELASREPTPPLPEMAEHGEARDFPTIGPAAGRALRFIAATAGVSRIFEFGSGFGYSAAWFLQALPDAGEIVLTDYDQENLTEARSFLADVDAGATVHYEPGDAMETWAEYEGPFELILLDHDKTSYADALEMALEQLPPGGIVIADNVLAGPTSPEAVRAALEGEEAEGPTAGIAAYLEYVRDETSLDSMLLPLGEGQLVSRRPVES